MAEYILTIARQASRELEALPDDVLARIDRKILALRSNPRPAGVKKLKGELKLWRIRVGDWRVVFSIDDDAMVVDILRVRHRSKAYE